MSFGSLLSGSKSANSATVLLVNTNVCRFGIVSARFGAICRTRFLARSSVVSRGDNGKFVMEVISLSVKSIASCGPATPRFSIVGILWPVGGQERRDVNGAHEESEV